MMGVFGRFRRWRYRHGFLTPRWTAAEVADIDRRARERAERIEGLVD